MQTDSELSPQVCEQASDSSSGGTPCLPPTAPELLESSSEPPRRPRSSWRAGSKPAPRRPRSSWRAGSKPAPRRPRSSWRAGSKPAPQMPPELLESWLRAPQTPPELLESRSESGFHAATRCLPQHTAQVALSSLPHSKKTVQK
ncbi:hypothetical protein JEQ12_007029 [Ovis aries]|uniref:Uncharacterized protein n=1 Tax=Ovis aries TaxID=9940 RepID=A0A836CVQ7_SHEEP|nr:hypothetical protein JEQ12_007029 [Ovis aries]